MVSDHAFVSPARAGRLGGGLRADGGGAASEALKLPFCASDAHPLAVDEDELNHGAVLLGL